MYTTNGQQSTEDGLRHHVVLDEQALHNLDIVNARLGVGRSTNPNTGDNLHRLAEHALQFAPASAAQGRTQDT